MAEPWMGRRALAVLMTAGMLAGCAGGDDGSGGEESQPEEGDGMGAGFFNGDELEARQDEYLAFASEELDPSSPLSVLAHAEWAHREEGFEPDLSAADFTASFETIDRMDDTSDFDMLYLINLWYGYRDELPDDVREGIEQRILAFKYWYTEPTPDGMTDNKWYWSENHRIIFHTIEYLAGQAFPDETFANDGRTGAEHRDGAEQMIQEWIDEKVRFGFSEWHSDVYYQKDVTPLLSLVEWAEDPGMQTRASMMLDVVLLDVALHLQQGNLGVTHGRSYMKDKSTALDQDVFGLAKLLFDDTAEPYQSRSDAGATLLARAENYRVPEVIRQIARSEARTVDRERMGVPLDPSAPVEEDPQAPYGYDFDDPANVPFWWERGAFTSWQVVGITLETADQYNLWETELFQPFVPLRDVTGGDPDTARSMAQSLSPMVALGLLSEVNTYTYRSPDVMLSSAQDYRPGAFAEQVHAWQATLDENAVVFTTHPKNEPQEGTEWPDNDGYWTGTGSLPRSAQQGTAAIHMYSPAFESPEGPPLDGFSYLPYTHAYFPQEHFDEVVSDPDGHWTFGRRGDGFVALYSWQQVTWRAHDPEQVFTHGMEEPFDLVTQEGAENVWIVEVGDAEEWESFEAFQDAVLSSAVTVDEADEGFEVSYESPTEGVMELGWDGPLTVDGSPVEIADYPRYDNPWITADLESTTLEITEGDHRLTLDFEAGTREATS